MDGQASFIDMPLEPFVPDAEISITAAEKMVSIMPGAQTGVWSYDGQLLSGSRGTVQAVPGSYLLPIILARSGIQLRIYFHNNLAEDSVIHPHIKLLPSSCRR